MKRYTISYTHSGYKLHIPADSYDFNVTTFHYDFKVSDKVVATAVPESGMVIYEADQEVGEHDKSQTKADTQVSGR